MSKQQVRRQRVEGSQGRIRTAAAVAVGGLAIAGSWRPTRAATVSTDTQYQYSNTTGTFSTGFTPTLVSGVNAELNFGGTSYAVTDDLTPLIVNDLTFNNSGAVTLTGNTLTLNTSSGAVLPSIYVGSGPATIGDVLNGSSGFVKFGGGTLTLNGSAVNTYTGATNLSAGALTLDFSNLATPTNLINPASPLVLGGALTVQGGTAASQTFAGTTMLNAASTVTASGSTVALGGITENLGVVVFNGPAAQGSGGSTVAATGTITTTFAGQASHGGVLAYGNNNDAFATVGLYDWASTFTAAGAAGTSPYTVIGGSQVSGFYTSIANNSNTGGDANLDFNVQQTPTGPGGTAEVRFASGTVAADTVRYDSGHAPEATVKSGAFFETGGILVTPDMGAVNGSIDGLRLANTSTQIIQNNTGAVFIIGSGNGSGPFFSNTTGTAAENVIKSGAGTLFLEPVTGNNLALNYLNATNVLTTVNTTSYNFTPAASASQYAFWTYGGVTVLNAGNALGNPATLAGTAGSMGSVNLNGGTVMGDVNAAVSLNTSAGANRSVWVGPNGGGLAAGTGTTFTVAGLVEPTTATGSGPLAIGIPASAANGATAGLVPGTGGTTANAALLANGTVVLSGANGYSGGTVVYSGTLNINGIYALGGGNYGGLTLNGGTLQYATSFSGNGSGDLSPGNGITVATGGGTIDTNGNNVTYANSIGGGGTGSLTKMGAGTLTLAAGGTYTGGTNLSAGTLNVTNTSGLAAGTGVLTVNGGTLTGNGSVGPVTLAGGTIAPGTTGVTLNTGALTYGSGAFNFTLGAANADSSINASSASFSGTPTFNYTTSSLVNGETFTVLTTTGGITGFTAPANLTVGRVTLSAAQSGNNIIVTANGSAANLVWAGTTSGAGDLTTWDIQGNKNWLNGASADYYYDGDNVTFNDANNGHYAVTLNTTVSPGSVTFNNSSGDYAVAGSGSIAGITGLAKLGSRSVTLSTVNAYSGGTTISGGKLITGIAGAIPAAGTVIVQTGGTLDLAGNSQSVGGLADGGSTTGTVTSSSGSPTLTLNNTAANAFGGTISGSLGLTEAGIGTLILSGSNTYTGGTVVTAGTLIGTGTAALGTGDVNVSPTANPATLSSNGSISSTANVTVNNNGSVTGTVFLNSATPTIGSLAGNGTAVLNGSSGTTLTTGNATSTTFSGVISQGAAASNVAVVGSGTFTLSGANTFTGTTSIGGTSTLVLGNALALQDSTLNYNNQGGTLSFGSLTAATVAGLNGTEPLALNNSASAGVTLTVGTNNTSSGYAGGLSGAGGLTKTSTGTFTLGGTNSYAGATNSNAGGTLVLTGSLGSSGNPTGAVTVSTGGTVNVSGGSLYPASVTVTEASSGSLSAFFIETGNATVSTAGALTVNSATSEGSVTSAAELLSGTASFGSVAIGRTGQNNGTTIQTTSPTNAGLYVDGAAVTIAGTLAIGTASGTNSSAIVHEDAGSVTVGGTTTIAVNNARFSVLDVAGGTFTSNDTGGAGIQVGGTFASTYAEVLVRGTGVVNTPAVTLGDTAGVQTAGNDVVELLGGTLNVGTGGIVVGAPANTGVTYTVNVGGTAYATAPTVGALADWSTAVPMTLTNSSTGVAATFNTADPTTAAGHTVTLTAALTGTGGLTKSGVGTLVLNAVNTYAGDTTVTAGVLTVGPTASLGGGNVIVGSATLTLNNSTSIADSAQLSFGDGSTVNLNGTASSVETVNALFDLTTNIPIGPGTYSAAQLNAFFGNGGPSYDVFNSANGELIQVLTTAAPEPTSLLLAAIAAGPLTLGRRRRRSA